MKDYFWVVIRKEIALSFYCNKESKINFWIFFFSRDSKSSKSRKLITQNFFFLIQIHSRTESKGEKLVEWSRESFWLEKRKKKNHVVPWLGSQSFWKRAGFIDLFLIKKRRKKEKKIMAVKKWREKKKHKKHGEYQLQTLDFL